MNDGTSYPFNRRSKSPSFFIKNQWRELQIIVLSMKKKLSNSYWKAIKSNISITITRSQHRETFFRWNESCQMFVQTKVVLTLKHDATVNFDESIFFVNQLLRSDRKKMGKVSKRKREESFIQWLISLYWILCQYIDQ